MIHFSYKSLGRRLCGGKTDQAGWAFLSTASRAILLKSMLDVSAFGRLCMEMNTIFNRSCTHFYKVDSSCAVGPVPILQVLQGYAQAGCLGVLQPNSLVEEMPGHRPSFRQIRKRIIGFGSPNHYYRRRLFCNSMT